jgi:uncharacterized LabA/DUF88 family protein
MVMNKMPPKVPKRRVYALIDGFNMYHALDCFDAATNDQDKTRFQKYKWLCFRTLMSRFVKEDTEELVKVVFFTAFPYWNEAKRLRHQTYVSALKARGVEYVKGEFKRSRIRCRATCKEEFDSPEEKQTDVNIATAIIQFASEYDTLILVTADSDQVPAVRLLKSLHPEKVVYILPPIGRNSKELVKEAGRNSRKIMSEQHLEASILPNPVDVVRDGRVTAQIWKPDSWPLPERFQAAPP